MHISYKYFMKHDRFPGERTTEGQCCLVSSCTRHRLLQKHTENVITVTIQKEGWIILTSIRRLQVLVLCMRAFSFSVDEILSLSEGSNTGMCTSSVAYSLTDSANIFKTAHIPPPQNLAEPAPKLIHTCCIFEIVCIYTFRDYPSWSVSPWESHVFFSPLQHVSVWREHSTMQLNEMRGADLMVHDW